MHSDESTASQEEWSSCSDEEDEDEREDYAGADLEWVESEKGKEKVSQME
jgi:hypothetical protein